MSFHIEAKVGEIAESVLLPGDPLRAKYIAENFLENAIQHNSIRGMLGYTGYYKGEKVSVQGTGMGMPSMGIYATELIVDYGCKNLIRIGSAGSMQEDIKLRDIVIAMSACTDSNINKLVFNGADYSPTADAELFIETCIMANQKGIKYRAGKILSHDSFYSHDPDSWKKWAAYGVLAIEMETAQLYTIAAKHNVRALSILTMSDCMLTGATTTPQERQETFNSMIELALETTLKFKKNS